MTTPTESFPATGGTFPGGQSTRRFGGCSGDQEIGLLHVCHSGKYSGPQDEGCVCQEAAKWNSSLTRGKVVDVSGQFLGQCHW